MEYQGKGAAVPWVLLELGWPAKGQPKEGPWMAKSGVRTNADPRFGLPYARDRLFVMFATHEALRHGESFGGNLRDVPARFGLSERVDTTCARLRRVAFCSFERPERPDLALCRRYALVDRLDLCEQTGDFAITLSGELMKSIREGAPVSIEVVSTLATRPGTLDLYLWQTTQIHRGAAASVPVCGAGGPFEVLPGPIEPSRAEQEMRRHNALIRKVWPDSPYRISPDGKTLICDTAKPGSRSAAVVALGQVIDGGAEIRAAEASAAALGRVAATAAALDHVTETAAELDRAMERVTPLSGASRPTVQPVVALDRAGEPCGRASAVAALWPERATEAGPERGPTDLSRDPPMATGHSVDATQPDQPRTSPQAMVEALRGLVAQHQARPPAVSPAEIGAVVMATRALQMMMPRSLGTAPPPSAQGRQEERPEMARGTHAPDSTSASIDDANAVGLASTSRPAIPARPAPTKRPQRRRKRKRRKRNRGR